VVVVTLDEIKARQKILAHTSNPWTRRYIVVGNWVFEQLHEEGFGAIEALSVLNIIAMLVFVAFDVRYYNVADGSYSPPAWLRTGRWANTIVLYLEFVARIVGEGITPTSSLSAKTKSGGFSMW
jgi:hypothetical protein